MEFRNRNLVFLNRWAGERTKFYAPLSDGDVPTRDHATPHYVIDDLADLRGSTSGVVRLPIELDWSPNPHFDLSNRAALRTMYQTVLRSARSEAQLANYLDAGLLADVWSEIVITGFIREVWEKTHPGLWERRPRC